MATQMILRTIKLRRGDTIIQQVPDKDNPYREVTLTEAPVPGEVLKDGKWIEVRFITGVDGRNRRTVKYTGTLYDMWQIVRED